MRLFSTEALLKLARLFKSQLEGLFFFFFYDDRVTKGRTQTPNAKKEKNRLQAVPLNERKSAQYASLLARRTSMLFRSWPFIKRYSLAFRSCTPDTLVFPI